MAVLDIVSPRIAQTSPTSFQAQPPHYGIIIAEPTTATPTVQWDTAEAPVAMTAVSQANLNMDVITDADASTVTTFRGKTVLRIAPDGALPNDPAGGTSREFLGTVAGIYKRTPQEDMAESGVDYLLVKTGNLYIEDKATQFTVLSDR